MADIINSLAKLDAATLGQMLDEVDQEFKDADNRGLTMVEGMADVCSRHFRIRNAYLGAVRAPLLDRVAEIECDEERPVTVRRWSKSNQAHKRAKAKLDQLNALGPAFYSTREHCDASSLEEFTKAVEAIYWIRCIQRKRAAERIQEARKAGMVKRTITSPTGYRKTGKHVRGPDGVKVPVVEKD